MDLSKLSTADKVILATGILLIIATFLEWFSFDAGAFGSVSESGLDYFFTGVVPMLIAIVLIGYVVVTKILEGVNLPDLPWPLVVLGLGGLAALLVILRLIIGGDDDGTDALDRSYGLFIATVAALGLAGGAFLKFQEEGGEMPNRSNSTGGTAGPGDGSSPTPF